MLLANRKKCLGGVLGVVTGLTAMFLPPPGGLEPEAMLLLGVLIFAICYWTFGVLPDYIVALLMCTLWVTLVKVPFSSAFGAFSSELFWFFFGALGLAAGMKKSGLSRRIALRVTRWFPANFKGQTMALLLSGMVVNPFIPSPVAKTILGSSLSAEISNALGYKPYSREATGVFLAAFSGYGQSGMIFLSGNVLCVVLLGLMPFYVRNQLNWGYWILAMMIWGTVFLIGTYLSIFLLYRPLKDKTGSNKYMEEQQNALGSLNKSEKTTMLISLSCLALWILEPVHGVPAGAVSLAGALLMFCFGVLDKNDLHSEIPWDSILLIGAVLNMGVCLAEGGVDVWLGNLLVPVLGRFTSPYALALVLTVIVVIARFAIVSMNATIVLFVAILLPIASTLEINPWFLGIVALSAMQIWYTKYQNIFLIPALAVSADMVRHKDMVKMSFAYTVYSTIGIFLSIPYWLRVGLL